MLRKRPEGRKPYFVGEFGAVSLDSMSMIFDSVITSGILAL